MPKRVIEAVQARAGSREFSAYITEAVQWKLQCDLLDGVIAEMAAQHGPADEAEVQRIMETMAR